MKIKIFDSYYNILYVDKQTDVNPKDSSRENYGFVNYENKQIRIYNSGDYSRIEVRKTIIHEVIHILFHEMHIDIKDLEEAIIALTLGINTIIEDNRSIWVKENNK